MMMKAKRLSNDTLADRNAAFLRRRLQCSEKDVSDRSGGQAGEQCVLVLLAAPAGDTRP